VRVLADLRRRLAAGEWASGEQMPTVRELAEVYGTSTRTVAGAYKVLAGEGLVIVTRSWGTHRA
jgi:GntR family transcriptional regulator